MRTPNRFPAGSLIVSSLFLLVLNLIWLSLTSCMCGYAGTDTAIVALPSLVIMAVIGSMGAKATLRERILNYFLIAAQSVLVAKVVTDLLWNGRARLNLG